MNDTYLQAGCTGGVRALAAGLAVALLSACAATQDTREAAVVPPRLSFAHAFVERLRAGGVGIRTVAPSKYGSLFEGSRGAAWLRTDRGTVDVVFFDDAQRTTTVRLDSIPARAPGRYRYTLHDRGRTRTIDASRPLEIVIGRRLIALTDSRRLAAALRKIVGP